jgi:hypothetical protein
MTVAEHKLLLAIGRALLGWRRTGAHLGRRYLRDLARLDGRTFERARDGLVERGLLHYTPGKPGRGGRGYYAFPWAAEKAAPGRPFTEAGKGRSGVAENAAPQRPRRGRGNGKTGKAECSWAGFDRSALTPAQLTECKCEDCATWRAHLAAETKVSTA